MQKQIVFVLCSFYARHKLLTLVFTPTVMHTRKNFVLMSAYRLLVSLNYKVDIEPLATCHLTRRLKGKL